MSHPPARQVGGVWYGDGVVCLIWSLSTEGPALTHQWGFCQLAMMMKRLIIKNDIAAIRHRQVRRPARGRASDTGMRCIIMDVPH